MTSFAEMKKASSTSFEFLNKELQNLGNNGNNKDDRYWKLDVDKAGNGYAILRFLPAPNGEDLPFTQPFYHHGFQGPGGWYIENSLTTLKQDDPVSEHNSELWATEIESNRAIARKQKRRLSYHANIYVVRDSANPQNEGKVFLYKFGKKIFDKLNEAMNPKFDDETPINPFDFWTGADFKLKARKADSGHRTYEDSGFSPTSPISTSDGTPLEEDEIKTVWDAQHSLKEIVDPKNFKTYDELKAKLHKVLGLGGQRAPTTKAEDDEAMDFTPKFKERQAPSENEAPSPKLNEDSGDDEDLDFFKSLADD